MNSDWIETFLDVLETGNFNQTADRLGLTQSTVSHRIKSLETDLGFLLFKRGRSGAAPTERALQFSTSARTIQREWNMAKRNTSANAAKTTEARFGIQYDLARGFAGAIVSSIRKDFPDTTLYAEVDYSAQMNADVLKGVLDFALVNTPSIIAELHFDRIGQIAYRMVSNRKIDLLDVRATDYIFPNISPAMAELQRLKFPYLKDALLSCGQSDALAQFLQTVGGVSYVSAPVAEELVSAGKLKYVKDAPEFMQDIYYVCHIRHYKNANYVKFKRRAQEAVFEV